MINGISYPEAKIERSGVDAVSISSRNPHFRYDLIASGAAAALSILYLLFLLYSDNSIPNRNCLHNGTETDSAVEV